MPDFGMLEGPDYSTPSASSFAVTPNITPEMQAEAARLAQPKDYGWFKTIAGAGALAIPDLIDTVNASIPGLSSVTGMQRGDFNEKVLQAIDAPGLTQFYRDRGGAVEVGSGLVGIVASEMLTRGALRAAVPFMGALRTTPYARRIMALDSDYKKALATVRQIDSDLAARGIMGAAQYVESAKVTDHILSASGEIIESSTLLNRAAAASRARRLGFTKDALRAGASEVTLATTLNENSFLFDAELSTNIMFGALGLGIGGALGSVGANYSMRKFVNSDRMQRAYAAALDPTGLERSRLDNVNLSRGLGLNPDQLPFQGNLYGSVTDRVTSLMVSARAKAGEGVDTSTHLRLADQQEAIAHRELNKVTTRGLMGVAGSSFSLDAPGFGNAMKDAMHRDPSLMLGVETIGGIGDGMSVSAVHEQFVQGLKERERHLLSVMSSKSYENMPAVQAKQIRDELKTVQYAQRLTPVPIIDGEATTLSHAEAFDNWYEPVVKTNRDQDFTYWEAREPSGKSLGVSIDSDLSIQLAEVEDVTPQSLGKADHFTMLRLYRAAGEALKDFIKSGKKMTLPDNPNWFQLDMAEQLIRKTGDASRVIFPGAMSRESAMIESLAQKAEVIAAQEGKESVELAAKLRLKLNLPRLSAYEAGLMQTAEHPLDIILRGANSGKAIRGTTLPELLKTVDEAARVTDLNAANRMTPDSLSGNSFEFLMDSQGRPTKPVMTYKRPFMQEEWAKSHLEERMAVRKLTVLAELSAPTADNATRTLIQNLVQSPDFQLGSKVSSLADIQMQAATPGFGNSAPSGWLRQMTDSLPTMEWKFRDNPIMLAVTRLRETAERISQAFMRETFERAMEDRLAVFNGPRNEASRILLNQFHSHAGGWHIKGVMDTLTEDGKKLYAFVLDDVAENRARFKMQYGREMGEGELLQSPDGRTIYLDELALDIQDRFNVITEARRQQQNTLRRAMGLSEIRKAPYYVPPPDVEGKFIGYTFDSRNQIVPGGTIIANTEEQFQRELAKMKENADSVLNRDGHQFRTLKQIKDHADLWDRVQMDMMNPGRTPLAGSKSNLGKNAGANVNLSAFEESMLTMRNGFIQHGRDLMEVMFKDQLDAAKARVEISEGSLARNGGTRESKAQGRSIFDYYVQEVTGRSPIRSEKSWVGRTYNELEAKADRGLAGVSAKKRAAEARARDYLSQANPYRLNEKEKSAFDDMVRDLGEAMPFKSALEYIEAKGLGGPPPTLAKLTGDISRFEATWILRMLEPVQAAMNMLGMINASPAVIRHLRRFSGETAEEYAARVGHSAQIFHTPDGRSFSYLDVGKLTLRGFKRAWAKEADVEFKRIAQKGMASQEVAEFQKAFNAAEVRSGWDLFMNGDPRSASKFGQKGLVGWLSVLTDKSEDFSRLWGHFIGLELAKDLGIKNIDAADNFAHDIANKMIANYSPHNRSEVFQGPVGAPIGLFMSFIQAYYQRLFRYAETRDVSALATQYIMQTGIFGLQTIPGWSEVTGLMESRGEDELPYDSVVNRLGQNTGDILLSGVIGNLPKLFGLDGIDVTSRGGTEVRLPVVGQAPAIVTTANKIKEGIGQAIQAFSSRNASLSGQQLAEIFSNTIPNRPIAGLIEQTLGGGYDVDSTGQIVSQTVTAMDAVARVLGTRSTRQTAELNAFYTNKTAQEVQASRQDILRRNTRAMIRAGVTDEQLDKVFEQYVANGGDPRNYKRWLRDQFRVADATRGERQLRESLRNPARQAQSQRLLNAYTSIDSEEQEEELPEDNTPMEQTETPGNIFIPSIL